MTAALALSPAMQATIVRRFCSCAPRPAGWEDYRCGCGLPRPRTSWSVGRLSRLRELMREHGSLATVAHLLDETQHDCNLALDALLGATPTQALARLEAQAARS